MNFLVVRLISVKLQWVELRTRDRRADSSHWVDLHSVQTSFRIILVQFMTFISTKIKIGTWQPCISSLSLLIQISKIVDISYTYIYHLEYQRFKTRKRKTRKFSHFFRFNPATALIFILRTRTIRHLFCIFTMINPVLTNNRGWETNRSQKLDRNWPTRVSVSSLYIKMTSPNSQVHSSEYYKLTCWSVGPKSGDCQDLIFWQQLVIRWAGILPNNGLPGGG